MAATLQYNLEIITDKVDSALAKVSSLINSTNTKLKLDVDSELIKGKVDAVKNQILGLSNSKIELQLKSDLIESKIVKVKSQIENLSNQNLTPEIQFKISTAENQVKQLTNQLAGLKNKELGVDIKAANLNTETRKIESGFAQSGKNAGSNFGAAFASISTSVLGAISFDKTISSITKFVASYTTVEQANLSLTGAIKATNNRQNEQQSILQSSTSTLEQKALALGFDTKNLYENVSATEQASNATQGLENVLKNKNRAFEDSQRGLENNLQTQQRDVDLVEKQISSKNKEIQVIDNLVNSIKKETDEKIKQLRISLGGDDLDNEKDKLDVLKNNLEIQRDQEKISGNGVSAKFTQIEIDKLGEQISLNQNKTDSINLQAEALKKQDEKQLQGLQSQKSSIEIAKQAIDLRKQELQEVAKTTQELIRNNKITFDANIEPIKRKIEDIRDSFSNIGGGRTVKIVNKELEAAINNAAKKSLQLASTLKIDNSKIDGVVNNLLNKFGKTLSKGDITNSVSDIIQAGISDTGQIETLLTRYVETASKSRTGSKDLGQAIGNLSQDFKNQSSALSQNSGLAENYTIIVKKGTKVLQEQALAIGDASTAQRLGNGQLTEAETRQAQYLGTLDYTNDTLGSYKDSLEKGLLKQSEFTLNLKKAEEGLGKGLLPAFNKVIDILNPFIEAFTNFATKNPEVVIAIAGLTLVLVGLAIILGFIGTLVTVFGASTLIAFAPIVGIVAAVVAVIGLLYLAFSNNFLGITDIFNNTFNSITAFYDSNIKPTVDKLVQLFLDLVNNITKYFTDGSINWQEKLGAILIFIGTLPIKLPILIIQAVLAIAKVLSEVDWGKMWNGLLDGAKGVLDSIGKFFNNPDTWKGLGRGMIDFIKGLLKGIGVGIPGADNVINPIIDSLPKFAGGGLITGPGTGISDSITAQLSNGEFVVNAKAVQKNKGILELINKGYNLSGISTNYAKNSQNNFNNQNQSINNSRSQNVNIYQTDTRRSSISQSLKFA
jgi:hypothetical protein